MAVRGRGSKGKDGEDRYIFVYTQQRFISASQWQRGRGLWVVVTALLKHGCTRRSTAVDMRESYTGFGAVYCSLRILTFRFALLNREAKKSKSGLSFRQVICSAVAHTLPFVAVYCCGNSYHGRKQRTSIHCSPPVVHVLYHGHEECPLRAFEVL